MKFKPTLLLLTVVVTMGLLLGTSAAQEAEVIFDQDVTTKAIGILNLEIDGTRYNVDFITADALTVYDPLPPGDFDFNTSASAQAAVVAVNDALNANDALLVGSENGEESQFYYVGWNSATSGTLGIVNVWRGRIIDLEWTTTPEATFNFDARTWATFTLAGPPPDPVTIGGSVSGLEGSGLVLQNNGGDDEAITADPGNDVPFTFDTALTPGTSYNVTVATNPTDQICVVANGSGRVPPENVTDITVLCTAAIPNDVRKIAAAGDTLPDNTVLSSILLDGGVAINIESQVAFGGRDGGGTDTVFTQAGKVVAEDDTLPDKTGLDAFRGQGELAINAGREVNKVAFHGMAESGLTDTAAVFTQLGKVASEGETIAPNTTVSDIDPLGKVAINNVDQVAFHGNVEIDGGLFGDEKHRVVFISDGQETREAARDDSELPDKTLLKEITVSGGVAINDRGDVAFHGETGEAVKAVFNASEGLVAKVGDIMDRGDSLDDIDANGGVAINLFGQVAFHGSETQSSGDYTPHVLIADGDTVDSIALLGRFTDDGLNVCGIDPNGGVAINLFGEVAFHGTVCSGGDASLKAVFIAFQDPEGGSTIQVVAKAGDLLADGSTILSDISAVGGVAIDFFGQVAFHGKVGSTDAVFVGQAPEVED